jgi:hypothetical protein
MGLVPVIRVGRGGVRVGVAARTGLHGLDLAEQCFLRVEGGNTREPERRHHSLGTLRVGVGRDVQECLMRSCMHRKGGGRVRMPPPFRREERTVCPARQDVG